MASNDLPRRYLEQHIALHGNVAYLPQVDPPPAQPGAAVMEPSAAPAPRVAAPRDTAVATRAKEIGYAHLAEPWTSASTVADLNAQICNCLKCALGHTRTKFVFGVGNPNAKLMLVGEAPGRDEDLQGEPFVGRAGQLLNKILEAINFTREEVFICNILKCRPPGNRDPLPEEVDQCEPYLAKQIDLVQPKIILALGRIAANTLLRTGLTMRDLRAREHTYHGTPLMATYHPAALLRNPGWKRDTWEDVKKLRKRYDELVNG